MIAWALNSKIHLKNIKNDENLIKNLAKEQE